VRLKHAVGLNNQQHNIYIFQFHSQFRNEFLNLLRQHNPNSQIHFVPESAFIAALSFDSFEQISASPWLIWSSQLSPKDKISSEVFSNTIQSLSLAVELVHPPGEWIKSYRDISTRIRQLFYVFSAQDSVELVRLAQVLAAHSEVLFIDRVPDFVLANAYARNVIEMGLSVLPDYLREKGLLSWDTNLLGQNQIVAIGDSGLDYQSCFFANALGISNSSAPGLRTFQEKQDFWRMFDKTSDPLNRKIVQYVAFGDSSDENPAVRGHGTHVAGSIAGSPVSRTNARNTLTYSGMAPEAKLAFFDLAGDSGLKIPHDLVRDYFSWGYVAGARIFSNSWGAIANGRYTKESVQVDEFMYWNKDALIVFSAGNDGWCPERTTSITSPATSKNALAVGASLSSADSWSEVGEYDSLYSNFGPKGFDEDSVAHFSSIGPTSDSRLKPDIVAPGFYIWSAASGQSKGARCSDTFINENVAAMAGTSMATGIISGTLALVRQYFSEGFYPTGQKNPNHQFTPSGALLKNVMIAGAVEMKGLKFWQSSSTRTCSAALSPSTLQNRPWYTHGFGRPQLNEILYLQGNQRRLHIPSLVAGNLATFYDRVISPGDVHSYRYCLYSGSMETRISLVWIDAPSSLLAGINLVNDLDLEVSFEGKVIYGNSQSNLLKSVDSGTSPRDRRNTVEVVYVSTNSSKIDLRVSINAYRINVGANQPYSVVISGLVSSGPCSASSSSPASANVVFNKSAILESKFPITNQTEFERAIQDNPLPPDVNVPDDVYDDGSSASVENFGLSQQIFLSFLLFISVLVFY